MDVELAADILDHDAFAGSVMHDVMHLQSEAPSAEYDGRDDDLTKMLALTSSTLAKVSSIHDPTCHCAIRDAHTSAAVSGMYPAEVGEWRRPGGQTFFFIVTRGIGIYVHAIAHPTLASFAFAEALPFRQASYQSVHSRAAP